MNKEVNNGFIPDQTPFTQGPHLIDYLNIIRKRKWVVIVFFLTVVCIVAYKTYNTTRVYKTNTRIMIMKQSSLMENMADVLDSNTEGQDYIELIKSRKLASEVIKDLGLREYVASNRGKPNYLTLALNRVRGFISKSLSPSSYDTSKTQHISTDEQNEDVLIAQDTVVDWYLSRVEVISVPDSSLVDISFSDFSPEMAARIANAHTRAFIKKDADTKQLTSQNALDWLKAQLREHKIKTMASQSVINNYTYQQLKSLSISDEGLFALPEIREHYVIQDLRKRLIGMKAQKMEINTKYGPKHPKIIEVDSSIKQLEQKIIDEVVRLKKTIEIELDRALVVEKNIKQTQEVQKQEAEFRDKQNSNYGMLVLEAESDKEIYDILLKQAKEISLTGNMEEDNIRIIDAAEIPSKPIKPDIFFNILLSVVLGLAFGIGFAFFFEYMDNTIKTPEDIMQRLGMPVIGMLPYDKSLKKGKTLALPFSDSHHERNKRIGDYAQYYDISSSLVASLPLGQSSMSGQILVIESATAGEGKTTVLAKSAISLARGGLRVVMVDADIHRSSLHRVFGLNNNSEGGASGLINAITRILSKKMRQGSLDKFSVADLFFLVALKKQSGKLIIKNESSSMTGVFENGCLFHLQSPDIPFANRLGTMLLRGGFITESQLKDALERNKRTGQPLGYILINAGYITQDQLQGPLKLQMEEHLQKLFSWKQGDFTFEPGSIETYEDRRIYFQEDYTPIINRLSRMTGSRLLEREVIASVKTVNGSNLSILPAGIGNTITPYGPLYFTLLAKFLQILKERFDVVLIDAPPILETMGGSRPLLSLADGIIFVAKSGHVSVKHIEKATTYMRESKVKIIGTVLNQVKKGNYYYKY
jgi:uncharacterized protein involved in exopolysaccharide biosynthesis/Mrp family chromosome partitioning ATPase